MAHNADEIARHINLESSLRDLALAFGEAATKGRASRKQMFAVLTGCLHALVENDPIDGQRPHEASLRVARASELADDYPRASLDADCETMVAAFIQAVEQHVAAARKRLR